MKILADSAILWLDKLFAQHAEIDCYTGRQIEQTQLQGVDALLTRSTLKVTGDLLRDTSVKFVGSATVGCEHVDQNALQELGIKFVHASGCNANAVSEYVISAIAWHESKGLISFDKKQTAAVIGCGRIGSKVKQKLEILGFDVVVNDPPLEQSGVKDWEFVDLEQALQANVICLHTPLTRSGDFSTYHLIDKKQLEQINPTGILLNAGRGEVINNSALLKALDKNPNLNVVLDVWENEPDINPQLLRKVKLGTPHIAGHSWRGKVMGTVMLYEQACKYFGWQSSLIDKNDFKIPVQSIKLTKDLSLNDVVAQCYDIENDTHALCTLILDSSEAGSVKQFDQFRKNYYKRAEFSDLRCYGDSGSNRKLIKLLGFDITFKSKI